MEFVICDDDRLYASQFIEQLKVLESQYDELFNCVYYDHYENFMESLRNKECDKADRGPPGVGRCPVCDGRGKDYNKNEQECRYCVHYEL